MKLQDELYGCAAAALANALEAVGVEADQRVLAALAGTTGAGTDTRQLQRAVKQIGGWELQAKSYKHGYSAWVRLCDDLAHEHPGILLADKGDHWVTAVGLLGKRIVVVDSAAEVRPFVTTYDREDLQEMWFWLKRTPYYWLSLRRLP